MRGHPDRDRIDGFSPVAIDAEEVKPRHRPPLVTAGTRHIVQSPQQAVGRSNRSAARIGQINKLRVRKDLCKRHVGQTVRPVERYRGRLAG